MSVPTSCTEISYPDFREGKELKDTHMQDCVENLITVGLYKANLEPIIAVAEKGVVGAKF